jgi:hypothetical protein
LRRELNAIKPGPITHGECLHRRISPEYTSWQAMKARCSNPNLSAFKYYGGRGISVCARWRDSFEEFLADMGRRPSMAHTLDRFPNNNGNYEPGNVRWATKSEQLKNRRRYAKAARGAATCQTLTRAS